MQWTESVGLTLVFRDITQMKLKTPHGNTLTYTILETFPFTSERKRMGIIVREESTGQITFLMKGMISLSEAINTHIERKYFYSENNVFN